MGSFYFEFTGFGNKKCVNYMFKIEKIGFKHLIMICISYTIKLISIEIESTF